MLHAPRQPHPPHLFYLRLRTAVQMYWSLLYVFFCSHLTSEMTKCRAELAHKESELQRLRRDVATKTSQISRMDERLHHMKSQIDSKTEMCMLHTFCPFYLFIFLKENKLHIQPLLYFLLFFNFIYFLSHTSPQWSIWRRRSISVKPTSSTASSGSRSWRDSFRWFGQSWLTLWTNYRHSEMFCKEPKRSQTSGKHQWKNWLSNLGEDTAACEISFCTQGQAQDGDDVHVRSLR